MFLHISQRLFRINIQTGLKETLQWLLMKKMWLLDLHRPVSGGRNTDHNQPKVLFYTHEAQKKTLSSPEGGAMLCYLAQACKPRWFLATGLICGLKRSVWSGRAEPRGAKSIVKLGFIDNFTDRPRLSTQNCMEENHHLSTDHKASHPLMFSLLYFSVINKKKTITLVALREEFMSQSQLKRTYNAYDLAKNKSIINLKTNVFIIVVFAFIFKIIEFIIMACYSVRCVTFLINPNICN